MCPLLPYVLGAWCAGWCGSRLCRSGTADSRGEEWKAASMEEAQEILHFARLNMGAYAASPKEAVRDAGEVVAYSPEPRLVAGTQHCPAHIIYQDDDRTTVVVAVRGLDMGSRYDFRTLCDNHKGKTMYQGGYVHHGLLQAAECLLKMEGEYVAGLLAKHPDYHLVFVGHSLGAGIAMLATILVADDGSRVGGISRDRLKGYGIAPPRAVSLDLAVKYADVVNGVVLQDDFLPRMSTTTIAKIWPVADRTSCFCRYGITCACCFIIPRCLRDSCISDSRRLKDPRRLYPAGRLYHVVVKEPWRWHPPPKLLTGVPVKGRFERVVITTSTFVDHNLTALIDTLTEKMVVAPLSAPLTTPPTPHKMERLARQNSRREDKERAESEMQKLEPARQRVEAQKVARDQAREGAGQAKRAGLEQTILDIRRRAGLERKEMQRLGGGESAPQGSGQNVSHGEEERTAKPDGAREEGRSDAHVGPRLEVAAKRELEAPRQDREEGDEREERGATESNVEEVETEGEVEGRQPGHEPSRH
ncbi:hypothetical protein KFL_006740020 [Klebsormidium nitens]|uniref:Fungal lipase-type domain-containing protein n=1 Tax=Klebsormidium nitens TaxID=105231 RepID=A0A1Y1IRC4_KLENI|nr:hypothetical protein KFL_006740020 [Klebsormidium nitens]|eukprot:GAQ90688.1 hypothetical protein KFL_006740020 [Klebsormidium nitens]